MLKVRIELGGTWREHPRRSELYRALQVVRAHGEAGPLAPLAAASMKASASKALSDLAAPVTVHQPVLGLMMPAALSMPAVQPVSHCGCAPPVASDASWAHCPWGLADQCRLSAHQ
jgi:hypothetical protein